MRVQPRASWGLIATVVAVLLLSLAAIQSAGQTRASGPSRAAQPNLNGIWQAITTANWDLQDHSARPGPPQFGAMFSEPAGQGVVEGGAIPYQPSAMEKQKENFRRRFTADPEAKCYLPGVPRATYLPYPFQIVQTPKYILIAYAYANATRTIHMAEAKVNPVDVAFDSWMGYSSGRWDGPTLTVETSHFNDMTWFDRAGNFHSDALRVTERYTPIDADHLTYDATVEDPKVFTRPWKISVPLYRIKEKNGQLLHFNCVEFSEELLYGRTRDKPIR